MLYHVAAHLDSVSVSVSGVENSTNYGVEVQEDSQDDTFRDARKKNHGFLCGAVIQVKDTSSPEAHFFP